MLQTVMAAGLLVFGLVAPAGATTVDVLMTFKKGIFMGKWPRGTLSYNRWLLLKIDNEILAFSSAKKMAGVKNKNTTLAVSFALGPVIFTEQHARPRPVSRNSTVSDADLTFTYYRHWGDTRRGELARFGLFAAEVAGDLFFDTDPNGFEAGRQATDAALVPVPASLPLLAGGFGLLAFLRRRRS